MMFYAVFPLDIYGHSISGIYTTSSLAIEEARKAGGEWVVRQYTQNQPDCGVPIWCDWADSGKDQECYAKYWPERYPNK